MVMASKLVSFTVFLLSILGCAVSPTPETQSMSVNGSPTVAKVIRQTRAYVDSLGMSFTGKVLVKPRLGHSLVTVEISVPATSSFTLTQVDLSDAGDNHYRPYGIGFVSKVEPKGVDRCQGTLGHQPLDNGTVRYLVGASQDSGEQSPGRAKIRYPAELVCTPEEIVVEGGSIFVLSFEVPEHGNGFVVVLNRSELLPLETV
jgi:hypothetical protein